MNVSTNPLRSSALEKWGLGHLLAAPKGNTHGVPNGIFPQLIHLMSDGGMSASKGSKMFVISQRFGVTGVTQLHSLKLTVCSQKW